MTTRVLAAAEEETPNFLLPNATIFVEFVLFLIVLFVLYRFVVPRLTRALDERQAMVAKTVKDRDRAAGLLREAEARYEVALSEARAEAASIRDAARAEAARIRAELKAAAEQEVQGIQQQGMEQLTSHYADALQQLSSELGELSTALAERVIGEPISDDEQRRSTVNSFLAELDQVPAGGGGGR